MSRTRRYRLGELFSGPGGMALGASRHGFHHAWAVDLDPHSCETYRQNIPGSSDSSVICEDVRDLDLASLSPIDCLAFGFPCNDFSHVGEQKGLAGKYGPLYSFGVHCLKIHQPMCFVAENVGGLRSANKGGALQLIVDSLTEAGYRVSCQLYRAEDYGIPQRRHRMILVGLRNDLNTTFLPPAPTTPESSQHATSRQALASIPTWAANQELTKQSRQVIERLNHLQPGQNAFSKDLPASHRLNVKGATISQIYRRLDPDRPAYTVTGSGGGGTHMYHWEEPRALTNRERARLQTFPDDYIFCGGKEAVRRQIGMAVPPLLAEVVFAELAKTLDQIV